MSRIVPEDPFEPITPEMWQALREAYPDVGRLVVAFALALDIDACEDLLAGRSVEPARLDPLEQAKAQEARLVQLVRPIDTLNIDKETTT